MGLFNNYLLFFHISIFQKNQKKLRREFEKLEIEVRNSSEPIGKLYVMETQPSLLERIKEFQNKDEECERIRRRIAEKYMMLRIGLEKKKSLQNRHFRNVSLILERKE